MSGHDWRSLDALFRPRSIAIVGASERPASFGYRTEANLRRCGYFGKIHLVNQRRDSIGGRLAVSSLSAIGEQVDLAYFAIPATQIKTALEDGASIGLRAAIVTASEFSADDADPVSLSRLRAHARKLGILICGPNNMGLINHNDGVVAWPGKLPKNAGKGNIAVISHSGSVGIALSQDKRNAKIGVLVTAGGECDLTAADYLEYLVGRDDIHAIAIFLESLRDPVRFAAAAERARAMGKRVVALKVGRSVRGQQSVAAHTGAIAGDEVLYDAFLRRHGILSCATLDELLEAVVLIGARAKPPEGKTFLITLSGGEAALLADLSAEVGLDLADPASSTVEALREFFPDASSGFNPLDAWGLGWSPERLRQLIEVLFADPAVGTVALCMDSTRPEINEEDEVGSLREISEICAAVAVPDEKELVYIENVSNGQYDEEARAWWTDNKRPFLIGMDRGLAAIANWYDASWAQHSKPQVIAQDVPVPLCEAERYLWLRERGVPMAFCEVARTVHDGLRLAKEVGYPVVLKGTSPAVLHKSELSLIKLSLANEEGFQSAWADLQNDIRNLTSEQLEGVEVVIQPMVGSGIELILGARYEEGFGTMITVGLGGIFVELLRSASSRMGPVSNEDAEQMLMKCGATELLSGLRGKPAHDRAAAVSAIVAFSDMAVAQSGRYQAIEINPLIVLQEGAVAVDAVFEASSSPADGMKITHQYEKQI